MTLQEIAAQMQAGLTAQARLGSAIRAWRESRGVAQSTLAGALGLHPQNLCDIEAGRRSLSLPKLQKLLRYETRRKTK